MRPKVELEAKTTGTTVKFTLTPARIAVKVPTDMPLVVAQQHCRLAERMWDAYNALPDNRPARGKIDLRHPERNIRLLARAGNANSKPYWWYVFDPRGNLIERKRAEPHEHLQG